MRENDSLILILDHVLARLILILGIKKKKKFVDSVTWCTLEKNSKTRTGQDQWKFSSRMCIRRWPLQSPSALAMLAFPKPITIKMRRRCTSLRSLGVDHDPETNWNQMQRIINIRLNGMSVCMRLPMDTCI